jgi:hypothetical protein
MRSSPTLGLEGERDVTPDKLVLTLYGGSQCSSPGFGCSPIASTAALWPSAWLGNLELLNLYACLHDGIVSIRI